MTLNVAYRVSQIVAAIAVVFTLIGLIVSVRLKPRKKTQKARFRR